MRFTDAAYDQLKMLVLLTFPLLSSLFFVSSYIWELPSTKTIMGMISIVSLLLGACLTVSTKRYRKSGAAYGGQILISEPEDGPKLFTLELNGQPEDIEKKKSVTFKVVPSTSK